MSFWHDADTDQVSSGAGVQLPDEAQLLSAAQEGDAEAFGQLYELYASQIFRFLYAHLSDRMDAEDLTEEVFIRVWRALPQYQQQGIPFGAFLFRIARNALIDHYRRSKRQEPDAALEEETLRDHDADPASITDGRLDRKELHAVLGRLREEYREVLVLRFLNDLSPDETADAMGKSPGAVRVLQHRALAALKKLLGS